MHWIKRFIYFSGKRHPRDLGAAEVTAFLNHLARELDVDPEIWLDVLVQRVPHKYIEENKKAFWKGRLGE